MAWEVRAVPDDSHNAMARFFLPGGPGLDWVGFVGTGMQWD